MVRNKVAAISNLFPTDMHCERKRENCECNVCRRHEIGRHKNDWIVSHSAVPLLCSQFSPKYSQ